MATDTASFADGDAEHHPDLKTSGQYAWRLPLASIRN